MVKVLYVMVGLPGSGKSHYVYNSLQVDKRFSSTDDYFVYSTDRMVEQFAAVIGKTYSEVFNHVIDSATKVMDYALTSRLEDLKKHPLDYQCIVWDQTNLGKKKRARILQKFPADEWERHCIAFPAPSTKQEWKVLEERLDNRPGKVISRRVMSQMSSIFVMPDDTEGFDSVEVLNNYGN